MARLAFLLSFLFACVLVGSTAPQPKIMGPSRVDAVPGEFPYFVHINDKSGNLISGGILIRKRVVLTIGYNYVNTEPKDFTVVLGTFDKSNNEPTRQEVGVTHIQIHPELVRTYNNSNLVNLALMRLKTEPVRGKMVKPLGIKRIVSELEDDRLAWNRMAECVSPGYGLIDERNNIKATKLQKYFPVVQPPFMCKRLFNISKKDLLCSLNEDRTNLCWGDGGSPLLCKDEEGQFMLHGMASYGTAKCKSGLIGWTQLSPNIIWIQRNARKLQLIK